MEQSGSVKKWAPSSGVGGLNSQARPPQKSDGLTREPRRALSDLSNTVAVNSGIVTTSGDLFGGHRCPLRESPAARRSSTFTVFDEAAEVEATAEQVAVPVPQQTPKAPISSSMAFGTNLCPQRDMQAGTLPRDLPEVQDFSNPMELEEQYQRAMSYDGACEGFETPAALADAILKGTERDCLEAEAERAVRWGHVNLDHHNASTPPHASAPVWPTMLTPQSDSEMESPRFPPLVATEFSSTFMDLINDDGME
jgi:hypothetical protein